MNSLKVRRLSSPAVSHGPALPARRAFTLIELLIVIGIIALLFSMIIAVYANSLTQARIDATRATIRQINSQLQDRMLAFERINLRSQAEIFIQRYNNANNSAPNPTSMNSPFIDGQKVAELMVKEDRFRGAFPQRLEDLWGFSGNPTIPDNAPLWNVWIRKITVQAKHATGGTPNVPNNNNPRRAWHRLDLENSELLYLIIAEGGSFGANSTPLNLNPNHVRDAAVDWNEDGSVTAGIYPAGDDLDGDGVADGNGIPEIYDEWNNPIHFYNAPTRLIRAGDYSGGEYQDINGAFLILTAGSLMTEVTAPPALIPNWLFANPLNQDPDDPTGALWAARNGEDLNNDGSVQSQSTPLPGYNEDLNGNNTIDPPKGMGYFYNPFNLLIGGTPVQCQPLSEAAYHNLNTYHRPLIISAGPDGKFGMFDPVVKPANAYDPMVAPLRLGRVTAEDVNLNGMLDSNEDLNNNGVLDQSAELDYLYDNITNRPQ